MFYGVSGELSQMPRKTYNTKADFDADYSVRVESTRPSTRPWIKMGYCRAAFYPAGQRRAQKLVDIFGWPTDTKILIVGAGYAFTAEALEVEHDYANIVTTDTSPHIQATQDQDEETEVNAAISAVGLNPASGEGLAKKNAIWTPGNRRRHSRSIQNEALNNNGSRNRIRSVLNGVQVAISEEVVTLLDDSEVTQLAGWIDAVDTGMDVIHLTTELLPDTTQDPLFNWKLLADWKALVPTHTWVSLNTWQVL